jgi:hypothetical protein
VKGLDPWGNTLSGTPIQRNDDNKFIGLDFENCHSIPYVVECGGSDNMWIDCRWDSTPARVFWNGNQGENNTIFGGFDSDNLLITDTSAGPNNYLNSQGHTLTGYAGSCA